MPANVSAETPMVVHGNEQANDVVDADGNSLLVVAVMAQPHGMT